MILRARIVSSAAGTGTKVLKSHPLSHGIKPAVFLLLAKRKVSHRQLSDELRRGVLVVASSARHARLILLFADALIWADRSHRGTRACVSVLFVAGFANDRTLTNTDRADS